MKKFSKINPIIILSIILLVGITFSVIQIIRAAAPDPGHTWTEIGDVTVTVSQGGTGQTSLTTNNVILGNGASAVQFVAPGTSGNVLTSNGTTWASVAPAGGGAPTDATYITQTANGTLSAEQALSSLATGPLKNTTGTGVLTVGNINLASEVTGNLPVTNLNSGTGAGATTFWRGDGTWKAPTIFNQSTAAQGAGFASDTYLTGSSTAIPSGGLKVGSRYHLIFDVSKTGAGIATPIIYVRFGTNGSTADTARLTFTFLAGTAVVDIGTFEVWVTFRTVGASGVVQGTAQCRHRLSITGLQIQPGTTLQVTSGSFDTTVANSIIGVSVNGGASASWTVQNVQAELTNLN